MHTRRYAIPTILLAAVLLAAMLAPQAVSAGAIIFVDAGATGLNDGASWTDAYTDLQPALARALAGDQIWVAAGTYKPTALTDAADPRSATFTLNNGVALHGGFGTQTALAERDWVVNITILSGDIGVQADKADNAYHVVRTGNSTDGSTVLDGFTVTAGNADSYGGSYYMGGGMLNNGGDGKSSPTVTNVTFTGNSAISGGGMYNRAENGGVSTPTLTNVTFIDNSASGPGGGMYNEGSWEGVSSPTLTNVTFAGNSASSGGGMYNGAESGGKSSPTLTNVIFSGNSAHYVGGGMVDLGYYGESNPTLTNVSFIGNSADSGGGGMTNGEYEGESNPTLTNVSFVGNSADSSWGGGMENFGGDGGVSSPTLTNVIFSGNSARNYGGGMVNVGYYGAASPSLINVVFSGNSAGDDGGGGMANLGYVEYLWRDVSPMLTNVTFSGNSAVYGGGMYNAFGGPTLANCILWGNTASSTQDDTDGPQIYNWESDTTTARLDYSLIEGSCPAGATCDEHTLTGDNDPRFLRNPSPGVDGTWGTNDDNYGDLHLQFTSPARDAGSNDALPLDALDLDRDGDTAERLPVDLDGRARIFGAAVDMGAYEVTPALNLVKTGMFDAGVDGFADSGDPIAYEFVVTNAGNVPLNGVSVTDSALGAVPCPADPLAVGDSMTCSASYPLTQADVYRGSDHNSATAGSDEGASATAEVTVALPLRPTGEVRPGNTTCQEFRDGTGLTMQQVYPLNGYVSYGLKNGYINNVSPAVFFYYGKVILMNGGSSMIEVSQANDQGWPTIPAQNVKNVVLWDAACTKVKGVTEAFDPATGKATFTGALPAGQYYLSVKWQPHAPWNIRTNDGLLGFKPAGAPNVAYTFRVDLSDSYYTGPIASSPAHQVLAPRK